ncbi:MAG TPA: glycosyltransferase, partial [Cellulomonadaceae bacterium]|nr:glycosyltransferase [Cellulomonadaceae bacterium]
GGFETCVEEVGRRLAERGHEVVVYCRRVPEADPVDEYLGMELVHLAATRRRSLETLSHTGLSVAHLLAHRVDAVLLFNAANSPWLPMIRAARLPVATHVDGLEWKRAKWGPTGKRYYRVAESLAVRWSDALIADATGIADYYREQFDVPTELIAYGAPTVDTGAAHRLGELGLAAGQYHLVVARFEPENHVHLIVDGYRRSAARFPLVVVGAAPYSDRYTEQVHALAGDDPRVHFVGGLWDQQLLDELYAHAYLYLHGHSVGGTNPSLLRAIGAATATTAFDVGFNREVLGDSGRYFATPDELAAEVERAEQDVEGTRVRAAAAARAALRYDWDDVTARYEELCRRLATGRSPLAGVRRGRRTVVSAARSGQDGASTRGRRT